MAGGRGLQRPALSVSTLHPWPLDMSGSGLIGPPTSTQQHTATASTAEQIINFGHLEHQCSVHWNKCGYWFGKFWMHSAFNFICKIRTAADWLGIDWHGILQHCSAAAGNLAVHCVTACGHRGTFVMQLSAAPSSSQLGKHSSTLHCFTPALPLPPCTVPELEVWAEATTHTTWANVKDGPWPLALSRLNGFPCSQGMLKEYYWK